MPSTLDAKKITSSELHTPRKGEKSFQNGNSRGKRGKEKNVLSRTMGLIYSEGKFVSGMTIPMRIIGWMETQREEREKSE